MTKPKAEGSAVDFFPERKTLPAFRNAAADCKACDLWERGTQTVFGEGARRAEVFFVGEQPGNEEDLTGKPFVGPAGRLFDDALAEAGIDRAQTYVTNVVKHFKWEPRGKRRIIHSSGINLPPSPLTCICESLPRRHPEFADAQVV